MEKIRLFHVSEESGIESFVPRPPPSPEAGVVGDAVWAVAESHLPNYLLPRDCPRVTFSASVKTSVADREKFFFGTTAERIIAVEAGWFERIKSCELYLYEFPLESFQVSDAGAGYFISRAAVAPRSVTKLVDPVSELLRRQVDVRFLPSLWPLRDAVIASSLEFSVIRFRNAQPRL